MALNLQRPLLYLQQVLQDLILQQSLRFKITLKTPINSTLNVVSARVVRGSIILGRGLLLVGVSSGATWWAVHTDNGKLHQEFGGVKEQFSNLGKKVDGLGTKVDDLDEKVTKLDGKVTNGFAAIQKTSGGLSIFPPCYTITKSTK
ncbi:MAG: hypothetical protein Q9221_006004 [Calogaya cf. arnoldii]